MWAELEADYLDYGTIYPEQQFTTKKGHKSIQDNHSDIIQLS